MATTITLILHSTYLTIAITGYYLLWKIPIHNGSGRSMLSVKKSGKFPDGLPLLRVYTGRTSLDKHLESAVIFYTGLTNGANTIHRRLLVDLHSTMQATAFCMLADNRRGTPLSTWSLIIPAAWGMFNQFYGAAFVYPLYLMSKVGYVINPEQSVATVVHEDQTTPLIASALFGSVIPFFFIYPAFISTPLKQRQTVIALYRFAPIAFVILHAMWEKICSNGACTSPGLGECSAAIPFVISGAIAAAVHMVASASALLSSSPWLSIRKTYFPDPSDVDPARPTIIADAAHLFLQYDLIVIALAFAPHVILNLEILLPSEYSVLASRSALTVIVMLADIVLGPGAVLAFVMAGREYSLRRYSASF